MDSAAAAPPPGATVPGASSSSTCRGPCRLCFENGGELIAPCLCKGSSKWIHRECLNQWRAAGHNPRALTNCCECGFQYKLQVCRETSDEAESRRRRVRRELASQGLSAFAGVQLVIFCLAALCRACDPQERLVEVWGLPQDDENEPNSFLESLHHHKTTYYLSGLVLFLLLLGISVCVASCFSFGPSDPSARRYGRHARDGHCDCGFYDAYLCTRCCGDCGHVCCDGCCDCTCCSSRDCLCPDIGPGHIGGDCGEAFAVVLVALFVIFVLIGLFAALIAVVSWAQRAIQRFSQVQEMRVLAKEFVVEDLAGPEDLEAAPVSEEMQKQDQPTAQRQVTEDLQDLWGGSAPREPLSSHATSYGGLS